MDLNEQATAETAMAVQWVPNGSVYATAAEELEYWSTAPKLESALAATRETAPSVDLNELLDEFCAAQPGSFSLYLQNPATGESYTCLLYTSAFGLASAAPRSLYRHLELCGIALGT